MTKMKNIAFAVLMLPAALIAGNPDRSGEAGASELLIDPWAQSSGWYGLNIASVRGVEAPNLNVAGLSFITGSQLEFDRTEWLVGTDISLNTFGFARKVGDGAIALTLTSMDLGAIEVTTTDNPDGTGATYKPRFSNLGVSYARNFADYLSGGITVRVISEGVADVKAIGVAMDVGIQYISGPEAHPEQIKMGITLRNVGTPMKFGGDGLSFRGNVPEGSYDMTVNYRSESFELPSQLAIGVSYDFYFGMQNRLTAAGSFISNSFYKDQFGLGLEYGLRVKNTEMFMVRAGYRYEKGITSDVDRTTASTGLAAGITFQYPIDKLGNNLVGISYSYRTSYQFNGSHCFGMRLSF
ncbi:MAG: PorV/PorQ family protein [Chitinophagales bacterium]